MNFEFTTHGGFDLVVDAWLFLANFFINASTSGLIATIFIAAAIFSAIAGPLSALLGGKSSMSGIIKVLFVGTTLYYILIAGTAQVTVYDDVKNKTQVIGNIPAGLAALAGVSSSIREGMETIIESVAGPPIPMQDEGYGLGMKMLQESRDGVMQSALASQVPEAVFRSASNYSSECLAIEAARTASIADGLQKTDDMKNVWPLGGNPALFADSNLDAAGNPTDAVENVSCDVAWNRLNAYFGVAGPWQGVVDDFCKVMSFDSTDPAQAQRCREVYGAAIHQWVAGGMTSENFAQNIFLGTVWHNYLASLDSNVEVARAAGNAQVQSGLVATGIMAMDFMPILKEVLIALIIMMTALVALFFVTGAGLEAFHYLFFLYVFWILFSAVDTAIACIWQGQINNLFAVIKTTNMVGTAGLDKLWPQASKSLAILGKMRFMGMLLVSSVMMAVFKWGGSAWAHLASNIASAFQAGAGVAGDYLSPGSAGQGRTMGEGTRLAEQYHRAIAGGMSRMGMDYATAGAKVAGSWGSGGQFKAGQDLGLGSTAHDQAGPLGEMRGKQLANSLGQTQAMADGAPGARDLGVKGGTNSRVRTEGEYAALTQIGGSATGIDLKTQQGMKSYAGTLATRALEETKTTGHISSGTKDELDTIRNHAGGGQMLAEAFNRVSVTPANTAEAKHLTEMGVTNAAVGRSVTASMYYGADGKLHTNLSQAEDGTRTTLGTRFEAGTSRTQLDSDRFDTNRSVLVNGDVLGTGQDGLYMVSGKGARAGSMVNFENATVTDMKTGEKFDRPFGMSMMMDPNNPGGAFSRAGNAAHMAHMGKPYDTGAALHLNNIDSTMHQDRHGVSGGFAIDNQAITQRVSTIAHGGANGAELFGGQGADAERRNLAFSNAYMNDLGGIVTRKGAESLRSSLDVSGSLYAGWSAGNIGFMKNITGFDAGAKMEVKDAIQKAALTDSGVDLVKSAGFNIWNSDRLTPQQKAVALDAMKTNLLEEASASTRTGNPADPAYERPHFSTMVEDRFVKPYREGASNVISTLTPVKYEREDYVNTVKGTLGRSGFQVNDPPGQKASSSQSSHGGKRKEDMFSAYGGSGD
jgi:hypothetical protein